MDSWAWPQRNGPISRAALAWAGRTYQLASEHNLAVVGQARLHLARLREKHGQEAFAEWWRDFAGEDPPADLDAEEEVIL